ncbi:MAG: pitrilysin family protein [Acidobacteriota bacterium]
MSNSTNLTRLGLVALLSAPLLAPVASAEEIAGHPRDLQYDELVFEVPEADSMRHELPFGAVAYVSEDSSLPLVQISVRLRIGSFLEPADRVGVAGMVGELMRTGGAGDLDPSAFDEAAAQLAANFSASIGSTSGNASLNCLSREIDACLDLFFSMMREPRFDADRLQLSKDNLLEDLKQRNDDPQSIASREWRWLLNGTEHHASRLITKASLDAVERDDLIAFHRDYWRPETMVFAISGDVGTQDILGKIGERLKDWPAGGKEVPWPPPEPKHVPEPGIYVAQKDIPQGRVRIGHLGKKRVSWDNDDDLALQLMNEILGGGGFTSRITKRVRSDEGLAYSAGSMFQVGQYDSGMFIAIYQSKSETVALAADIVLEELERIRTEPVTAEELETAKASFIDTFPSRFDSKASATSLFAQDEVLGRPHSYWTSYRDRLAAVTPADIQRVANEYLRPDEAVVLIVGNWQAIEGGDADGRADIDSALPGRTVVELPERDPLTLEPTGN